MPVVTDVAEEAARGFAVETSAVIVPQVLMAEKNLILEEVEKEGVLRYGGTAPERPHR